MSHAEIPPERSRIVAGQWWPRGYGGPPQMSFAAGEAAEMGLGLGDRITLNMMGREITAERASLREVNFSTAGMGFVMVMNPSALAGAPHSFIATAYAEPGAEALILREITEAFPNITAIGVRETIEQVSGLLAGLAAAIRWGASATLLTGLLVLVGTAAADARALSYEAAILKVLGAKRARILAGLALRPGLLGAAAGLVALGAGIAGGWAVSRFVMETRFVIAWAPGLMIVTGGAGLSLLAGIGFALGPISVRPAQVLRARE